MKCIIFVNRIVTARSLSYILQKLKLLRQWRRISCHITLPSNAPINQILGTPQLSMEASKRDACLKAIEELYNLGTLSDCLLPKQDDAEPEAQVSGSSDEDECEGQTLVAF